MTDLGAAIRSARAARGLTLGDVARATLLDRSYLGRVEAGKRTPSMPALEAIAATLGVTAGELLNRATRAAGKRKRGA